MRSRTRLLISLLVLAGCSVQAGSALAARNPAPGTVRDLALTPKAPKASQTVSVFFTAPAIRSDRRLDVSLRVADAAGCSGGYGVRIAKVVPSGQRIRLRFSPRDKRAVGLDHTVPGRFCAGVANVVVGQAGADGRIVVLARKRLRIAPSGGPETFGTPGRITVLDGSAIAVKAPGRPDRSHALGGLVRGFVAGPFRPATDIVVGTLSGGLWMRSLAVDPLCAGAPIVTEFPVAAGSASQLLLKAGGEATLTLVLKAGAVSLAGCTDGAAATTPLTLAGKVTDDGLVKLPLTGSVDGVTIAPGVGATVTVSLLLGVDLSGRT